ncbi:MAG: alkaline phosphatase family protein [Pseudomonadota bacterium]
MMPSRGRCAAAVLAVALVVAAGCDGPYQQFLDSVPVNAIPSDVPAEVFLAIDGLSRQAFDRARARGAFAGWNTADLITAFPGTSDYAWTRTLRAGAMGGYEIQYFDPGRNVLQGAGLAGVAAHPFHEGIAGTYPCYQRFDFVGDGETWQLNSYLDPAAALTKTLDALFDTVAARGRTQSQIMAYVINVDVVGHEGGLDAAVAMLVEIDRRIRAFQADHERPYRFTIFADHGNAHLRSALVDPRQILRDVGVTPVESLRAGDAVAANEPGAPAVLEAVPVVHVRVNYVALHAARKDVARIAALASRHPQIDLAVAPLVTEPAGDGVVASGSETVGGDGFAIWRDGEAFTFRRDGGGNIVVDQPDAWTWLGADLRPWRSGDGATATLDDRAAFAATRAGPYPDIFYRVATAFTHPAARFPADILLSMPDDVASYGFNVPGAADIRAADGFHGSLSRASTMSVVASQSFALPEAVRGDDLADMFPLLRGERPRPVR